MLEKPTARKLLPEAKKEFFAANTHSFVIHDADVKNEQVLGSKFNEEMKEGKIFSDRMKGDERLKDFDKLIDEINDSASKE